MDQQTINDGSNLLIFGCGFSGKAIASEANTYFDSIWGTHRKLPAENQPKPVYKPLIFDGDSLDAELIGAMQSVTHLVISIAPNETGDPAINALRDQPFPNLKWIGYLSTVGVYGNHDGAWVDETTVCRPVSKRSVARVQAEKKWSEFAIRINIPLAIFRLSGIYGPGRNALKNIEKGTTRRLIKPGQVFNRIHVHDIAGAVNSAIKRGATGIFNITDDEPAPPQDVVMFAHDLTGTSPPPEIDFATADLSPMARSFYGENKRVSNARSKNELGYVYKFPDYRKALRHMWDSGTWR